MKSFPGRSLLSLSLLLASLAVAAPVSAQQLAVAGSPVGTIADRNYKRLFQTLMANGIKRYFPTFQYEEVPRPRSLGFETDFTVPCSPNDASFRALRETGMKLLLPAELVYPNPGRIGRSSAQNDPLNQIIACAGRDRIAGISNYDEALFQGIPLNHVAKLYAHVKSIDPTMPVLMVHGPIITDKPNFSSLNRINRYLQDLKAYSAHADVVGFDVYPVPAFVSKVATPLSNGQDVTPDRAVAEYMRWLNQEIPNKRKLMVLQGFAYSNLYEKNFRERNFSRDLLNAVKPPNRNETNMMLKQARDAGVDMVIWWGVGALPNGQTEPWPSILEMGRRYGK